MDDRATLEWSARDAWSPNSLQRVTTLEAVTATLSVRAMTFSNDGLLPPGNFNELKYI